MIKKWLKLLLKLSVSVGLFWLLFTKIDANQLSATLSRLNLSYIPVVILLIVLNYIISSIRWQKLIWASSSLTVPLGYLTTLYFTGSFFNNFMPTSIGGDVYKIVKLSPKIQSKSVAFIATFTERFLGVIALAIIASFGAVKIYGYWIIVFIVGALLMGYLSLHFFKFLANKISFVKKIMEAAITYKDHKDSVAFAFVFSFLVQFLAIFSQYYVFVALGQAPPFFYALTMLPLITLAGFFIPSLNGIGIQDALYVSLFGVVGVSADVALSASISYHVIRLAVSLIGGVLYAAGLDE